MYRYNEQTAATTNNNIEVATTNADETDTNFECKM